jgi:hypothetical protein
MDQAYRYAEVIEPFLQSTLKGATASPVAAPVGASAKVS